MRITLAKTLLARLFPALLVVLALAGVVMACSELTRDDHEDIGKTEQRVTGDSLYFKASGAAKVMAGEAPNAGECTAADGGLVCVPVLITGTGDGGIVVPGTGTTIVDAGVQCTTLPVFDGGVQVFDCTDASGGDNQASASWWECDRPGSPTCPIGETSNPPSKRAVGDQFAAAAVAATTAKASAQVATQATFIGGKPPGIAQYGTAAPFTSSAGGGLAAVAEVTGTYYGVDRHASFGGRSEGTGPTLTLATSTLDTSNTSIRGLVNETASVVVAMGNGYGLEASGSATAGGTTINVTCTTLGGGCRVVGSVSRVGHGTQCCGPYGCGYPGTSPASECQLSDKFDYWISMSGAVPLGDATTTPDGGPSAPVVLASVTKLGKSIHRLGDSVGLSSAMKVKGGSMTFSQPANVLSTSFAGLAAYQCPPAPQNCAP